MNGRNDGATYAGPPSGGGVSDQLERRYERLRSIIAGYGSILVAYSGGVDSSLLLAVAHDVMSRTGGALLAVLGRSPSVPRSEIDDAVALAARIGARLMIVDTDEIEDPRYAANPPDRCYYCKSVLYDKLTPLARSEGIAVVADGANIDDLGDYRPGQQAAGERGIASPLREAGLTKADIRALAKRLNLPTWDKPAAACLASRISYGETITPENLRRVELAEQVIRSMGFRQVRVRTHGDLARIEVAPDRIADLAAEPLRTEIYYKLKEVGFIFVAIDAAGYRTGSLNERLGD